MLLKKMPSHIAIIMDGNGRWAKERGKNRTFGHKYGAENVRRIIKHAAKRHISYLTLFTFSTENWNRPRGEVSTLMRMFSKLLDSEIDEMHRNNVKVSFIGRRKRISKVLLSKMQKTEKKTEANTGINLVLAIDYGGKQEILDACMDVHRRFPDKKDITEDEFRKCMYYPELPDIDLLIRTADEKRISNFLLWQGAYAELHVSSVYWPDFDENEFDKAVDDYMKRERKFGKINKK